jgi:hypothetical protein
VIGDIRGAPVELSEQVAARAILKSGRRYPQFGWGHGGADFEVDLRKLPSESSSVYWPAGKEAIVEQLGVRLRDAVARGKVRHLSVFGLARIPLIELGRGLVRGAQPAVRIYDRQHPGEPFAYALEINR